MSRALFVWLLLALPCLAQDSHLLRYALDELVGQSTRYRSELDQSLLLAIEGERKELHCLSQSTYRCDFSQDTRRRFELRLKLESLRLETGRKGQPATVFDSSDPEGSDAGLSAAMRPLLQGSSALRMNEDGSRARLTGRETGVEKRLLGLLQDAWPIFPELPLSAGDSWKRTQLSTLQRGVELQIDWEYQLEGFEAGEHGPVAVIHAQASLSCETELLALDNGSGQLSFRFDVTRGVLLQAEGEVAVSSFGPGSETEVHETFSVELLEMLATPEG